MTTRSRTLLLVLGPCAAATLAVAPAFPARADDDPAKQPIGPMTIEPAPAPAPPADPVPRPVFVPGNAQPALQPVRPGLPPPAAADLGLPSVPALLREGSYITNARGQIVKGKSGRWYVVFDQEPEGRALPPMILAENSNLAAMERSVERLPEGTRYRIAGRVTVYRDHNYLLPSMPPMVERAPASSPAPALAPAAEGAGTPGASAKPSTDPSISDIIAELDKAVGPSRPRAGEITAGASPAPTPSATDPAEGDQRIALAGFLANRRARIVRTDDGRLAARLDGGASGHTEGPMVLLPCQNLAAIDAALDSAASGGDSVTFTLSGEVMVYKGRNYLLPTMYVVNRATDIVMPTH